MADADRPDDGTARGRKRRRKPPVIELQAKEVSAPGQGPEPGQDAADAAGPDPTDEGPKSAPAFDMEMLRNPVVMAGGGGVLAGLLLAGLLLALFGRGGADPQIASLSHEIQSLSSRMESMAALPGEAGSQLGARIDKLTDAIGAADRRLAAIERRPVPKSPDLAPVQERAAAIETALADLRSSLADLRRMAEQTPPAATPSSIDALGNRIGAIEQRISAIATAQLGERVESAAAVELAALHALSDAIDSGRPFEKELATARAALGSQGEALAPLEASARSGVATLPRLVEEFAALAPKLLHRSEADGNLVSRVFDGAMRLVEVRPVGEPQGNDAGAVVARIETKLARGDLDDVLAETKLLPDAANEVASGWLSSVRQRRDAKAAVASLTQETLAAATGSTTGSGKP